jgi:hypothetical protein
MHTGCSSRQHRQPFPSEANRVHTACNTHPPSPIKAVLTRTCVLPPQCQTPPHGSQRAGQQRRGHCRDTAAVAAARLGRCGGLYRKSSYVASGMLEWR